MLVRGTHTNPHTWEDVDSFVRVDCNVKQQQSEELKHTARLVYQTALMESGFNLPDPKEFASSIYKSVQKGLDLSPDATVEEDEAEEQPEVEEKEPEPEPSSYDKDEL